MVNLERGILIKIQKMFKDEGRGGEGKLIMEAPTSNANIFLKYFRK